MICTSSYKDFNTKKYKTYSISWGKGKSANYEGECYPALAPKLSFWNVWKENIGIISEEENNKYYIREYYNKVLSNLNPETIYQELDNSVLLCYEDNMEFCHRHIVAAWLELLLDVEIPEVKLNNDVIQYNINKPEYIKEYLEKYMKSIFDMKDFNSLRELYLSSRKAAEKVNKKIDGVISVKIKK